jgi:hypothetical protein
LARLRKLSWYGEGRSASEPNLTSCDTPQAKHEWGKRSGEVTLASLHPGDYFGEAVIKPVKAPEPFALVAKTDAMLIVLDAADCYGAHTIAMLDCYFLFDP